MHDNSYAKGNLWAALALVFSTWAGTYAWVVNFTLEDKVLLRTHDLKQNLEKTEAQMKVSLEELASANKSREQLEREIADIKSKLSSHKQELSEMMAQHQKLTVENAALQSQLEELQGNQSVKPSTCLTGGLVPCEGETADGDGITTNQDFQFSNSECSTCELLKDGEQQNIFDSYCWNNPWDSDRCPLISIELQKLPPPD